MRKFSCRLKALFNPFIQVNTICWSEDGHHILSGSDDRMLSITDPFGGSNHDAVTFRSYHEGIIFCAKFLPKTNSTQAVSCGARGIAILHDLNHLEMPVKVYQLCQPSCSVKQLAVFPNSPSLFLACCPDRVIRLMDTRLKSSNRDKDGVVLINGFDFANAIDVSTKRQHLVAVGTVGPLVALVDLRNVSGCSSSSGSSSVDTVCSIIGNRSKSGGFVQVTSVQFAPFGDELLSSFSRGDIYLLDSIRTTSASDGFSLSAEQLQTPYIHFRLPGDWSDTGPHSDPSVYSTNADGNGGTQGQISMLSETINRVIATRTNRVVPRLMELLRVTSESHPFALISEPGPTASLVDHVKIEDGGLNFPALCQKNPNLPQPVVINRYTGHRNCRTKCKEANFWGGKYVISGSDCGRIFVWNKLTGDIVAVHEGDQHVVNCVQPHPFMPILASSGIDHNVKVWAPVGEDVSLREMNIEDVCSNLYALPKGPIFRL
ncbi:DDB1 and CUL4 associated factor 6 [Trichuris trichiura]|uniref:DDB1 and CUL4 associated factor 6 n=1 Tax=Trichuris trichiura TaxID=36087 RepID=A0A077YZX6_TRITR|nr:DDB1 and CUL4 associated factor 6 [Trichuris trichiura]